MNIFWSQHLKHEVDQQENFEKFIRNSKPVLDRAIEYVNHKATGVFPSSKDYGCPNWDYLQADRNGYLRALAEVEAFLNLDNNTTSIRSTWLTKTNNQQPQLKPFFKRLKANLLKLKRKIW